MGTWLFWCPESSAALSLWLRASQAIPTPGKSLARARPAAPSLPLCSWLPCREAGLYHLFDPGAAQAAVLLTDTLHSLWDQCCWIRGETRSMGTTLHSGGSECGQEGAAQVVGSQHQDHCVSLACWLFSPCIQGLENTGVQSHWEPCEHWAVTALLLLGCGRLTPTVTSSPGALGTAPGIRYPSFA